MSAAVAQLWAGMGLVIAPPLLALLILAVLLVGAVLRRPAFTVTVGRRTSEPTVAEPSVEVVEPPAAPQPERVGGAA